MKVVSHIALEHNSNGSWLSINEFNTQIFSRTTKFSKERFIFFVAIQVYSEPLQLLKIFIDFKLTTKLSYIFNIMNLLSENVNRCLKIWCPILYS